MNRSAPYHRTNTRYTARRHFTAIVYERFERLDNTAKNGQMLSIFDVEVYLSSKKVKSKDTDERSCVYRLSMRNARRPYVTLERLTNYMAKKFSNYQLPAQHENSKSCIKYTYIINELEWIKSIINVEFDFHLGDKVCMRPENSHYLQDYCSSSMSGYGEPFYTQNTVGDIDNVSFMRLFG